MFQHTQDFQVEFDYKTVKEIRSEGNEKVICCVEAVSYKHLNREIPGVEMNTGALGHGLSSACGMAKAGKMQKKDCLLYTSRCV